MKKLNLLAVVACIGLAFGLTSCKDEKKLVGSWEVVKTQEIKTFKGDTLPSYSSYYKNVDTTIVPQKGESMVLTFSKKGVVLKQYTDSDGNPQSYTDAYTILDDKLYFDSEEYTMSFKGKDLTLTTEETVKSEWEPWDSKTGKYKKVPYTRYSKTVIYLKEH